MKFSEIADNGTKPDDFILGMILGDLDEVIFCSIL